MFFKTMLKAWKIKSFDRFVFKFLQLQSISVKLQGKKLPRSLPIKLQDPLYKIFWRFYCILYFFWVTVSNKCTAWAGEPRAGSQESRLRCLSFSSGRKCWFKNSTATFCSPKKNPQSIQLHTIKCKLCCVKQGIPHTAAAHLDTACTKILSPSPYPVPAEWPLPWDPLPPSREDQPKLFCLHDCCFPMQLDEAGEDPVRGIWAESLGSLCERISRKRAK